MKWPLWCLQIEMIEVMTCVKIKCDAKMLDMILCD